MLGPRRPLSLPYEDQVPRLASLLDPGREGESEPVAPRDPDRFVDAALYHYVAGYVATAAESGRLELGPAARRRLTEAGLRQILHSRLLRAALPELLPTVAEASGAAPVLLKGPAVADRFYADPRMRPFVDLDLLVPRESLRPAVEALREVGYEQLTAEEFRPGFGETYGHDVSLGRSTGSRFVAVELHWRVQDDPAVEALDHAQLVSRADWLDVDGVSVAVPGLADQLLGLAVHLLNDRTKRLCWVNDIAVIGGMASETQWDEAFERARRLGLGWVLHRALDYPERHLGFDRPRPLGPGAPPRWGPLRASEELDAGASKHVGRLAALPWHRRPRYLCGLLVPTRAWLRRNLGRDGASTWRLLARHARAALASLGPRDR